MVDKYEYLTKEAILHETTRDILRDYNVIYNNQKKLASQFFDIEINSEEVLSIFSRYKHNKDKAREDLKNYLIPIYGRLQKYNLRQLHFHLPNNESFLRMHRLNRYGDDLTDVRSTVAFVNKYKRAIDGFEQGRIYSGYRYLFPIWYKNDYLGSVEISFSAAAMVESIMDTYKVIAQFLIKEDITNNKVFKNEKSKFSESPVDGYFFEKEVYERVKKRFDDFCLKCLNKDEYKQRIENKEVFSIESHSDKIKIITIIPIINPITNKVVSVITIFTPRDEIIQIENSFLIFKILVSILIFFILLAFYVQVISKKILQKKDREIRDKNLALENINSKLEKLVALRTQELKELNMYLEDRVKEEIAKNEDMNKMMIAQSRNAAMGEMISMIAHQWRQPLGVISMNVNSILINIDINELSSESLKKELHTILEQISYLSQTIEDFRNFFKPNKEKEKFNFHDVFQDCKYILGKKLDNNSVKIIIDNSDDDEIYTYSRELLQVYLNLIKNSSEVLVENNSHENRNIFIKTYKSDGFFFLEVCDNGGGIPEDIKDRIFEPYFSTKDEKNGTGLGLYMSKIIVEKHLNGKIYFENRDNGVCFIIEIPL